MSQTRRELRVGILVLLLLTLVAMLLLQFSKGNALFRKTYTIILHASNAGGIRKKSAVMMSGVPVGTVSALTLDRDGTNASIYLRIYGEYQIRDDSRFLIEQSSFFSDQFVAIHPGANRGTVFTNLADAHVEEPFNLLKAARSGSDIVHSSDESAKKLDDAFSKMQAKFLSEKSLTNVSHKITANGEDARGLLVKLEQFEALLKTNHFPAALSNLEARTEKLNGSLVSAEAGLNSNQTKISAELAKLRATSGKLTNLLTGIQEGQGTAGEIFGSQDKADQISNLTARLANTSSNINQAGLWHALMATNKAQP